MQEMGNEILQGGGEMGKLSRSFDWSSTSIGDPKHWPSSLLTTVNILLNAKFPMFLWWGNDLIQFYNDAYRPSLGNTGKHPTALGQKGADCWKEIWPVIKPLIDQVINGGESVMHEDELIPIYRNDHLEDVYWTFSYSLVRDDKGTPGGVLVICTETTEKVRYQQQLEQSVLDLRNNQARLHFMLEDAPVAIALMTGRNLVIESANKRVLEIWGKTKEILGQPLAIALPELQGQPFLQILDDVYTTGKPFYGKEMRALLEQDGVLQEVFTNFVYHPIASPEDDISSIMLVASIITEEVLARKALEATRDTLHLAHAAAELGTFDMNLETGQLDWDSRCRILFGISHNEPVSYEKDFVNGLHPDDRPRVLEVIDNLMASSISNGDYDIEYRTIGAIDKQIRWLRAKGKVYFDNAQKPLRFIGAVLDITESKNNEARKNDFIAMVSHELKTPLTTLKGYSQLVSLMPAIQENELIAPMLSRIEHQVNKMTSMINGFLNVARLESGKIVLEKATFKVHDLIASVVSEFKDMSVKNNFIVLNDEPVSVVADYEKIGQVLNNLLTNAIKYGTQGAPIEISYNATETFVQIKVSDHGVGIEENELTKIFDRFYRVENQSNKNVGGFGIGLYLSAALVEEHGGTIGVKSTKGEGSCFYFSLPL